MSISLPDDHRADGMEQVTRDLTEEDRTEQCISGIDRKYGESEMQAYTANNDRGLSHQEKADPNITPEDAEVCEKADHKHEGGHSKFVASLERHGSSAGLAWHSMAEDLKWTVDEVKLYAYSYFKALIADRTAENHETASPDPDPSWSFHELVLLDSLMLKYSKNFIDAKRMNSVHGAPDKENNDVDYIEPNSVWERIASYIPDKTPVECKKRGLPQLLKMKDTMIQSEAKG